LKQFVESKDLAYNVNVVIDDDFRSKVLAKIGKSYSSSDINDETLDVAIDKFRINQGIHCIIIIIITYSIIIIIIITITTTSVP